MKDFHKYASFTTARTTCASTLTKVRDRDCGPTAADVKRALRLKAEMGIELRGAVVDIQVAHQLIPIDEWPWRNMGET